MVFVTAKGQEAHAPVYSMTLQDCLQFALTYNYSRQSSVLGAESKELAYDQSKQ